MRERERERENAEIREIGEGRRSLRWRLKRLRLERDIDGGEGASSVSW